MKILFYLEREVKQKKMGNLKMTVLTMAVPKNFAKINRQQMKKKKKNCTGDITVNKILNIAGLLRPITIIAYPM